GGVDGSLAARAQPALGALQLLGDLLEAFGQASRLEEGEVGGEAVAPGLLIAAHHVADGVALAHAGLLEAINVPAVGVAQVAAGEAGEGPAHRLAGAGPAKEGVP